MQTGLIPNTTVNEREKGSQKAGLTGHYALPKVLSVGEGYTTVYMQLWHYQNPPLINLLLGGNKGEGECQTAYTCVQTLCAKWRDFLCIFGITGS